MTEEEFLAKLDTLPDSQLISEKHVSAWLQMSLSKIQKDRVKGNGIPFIKPGGAVRYSVGEVRRYLKRVSYASTSGYELNFEMDLGVLDELRYGPCMPFAVVNGKLCDFFDTLDQDVEEIRWLNKKKT